MQPNPTDEVIDILTKVMSGSYDPTEQERYLMNYVGTLFGKSLLYEIERGAIKRPTSVSFNITDAGVLRFAHVCNYLIAPDDNPVDSHLKHAIERFSREHAEINKRLNATQE